MRSSLILAGAAALASATSLDVYGYKRQDLNNAAIKAPITKDCYTYIQHSKYSDVTDKSQFDPQRCIRDCEKTTAYNKQNLNGRASCRFVNTYILLKDGVTQGQICSMYTASWDASYATNTGYTDDEGHKYTICDSYSYSKTTDPGVPGKDCVGGPYEPQPPVKPTSTQIPSYPSSTKPPTYPSSTFSTVVSTTKKTTPVKPTTTSSKTSTTAKAPSTTPSTTAKAPSTTPSTTAKAPSTTPSTTAKAPSTTPSTTAKAPSTTPSTTAKAPSTTPSTTAKAPSTTPSTTAKAPSTTPSTTAKAPSTTPSTTAKAPSTTPSTTARSTSATTSTSIQPNPSPAPGSQFECTGLLSSPQCCQTNALGAVSITCDRPSSDFTTRDNFRSICAATGKTASCCLLPALGQGIICQDV